MECNKNNEKEKSMDGLLENNKEIQVNTVALIKATQYDSSKFKKTKLFEELMNYDENRKKTEVSDCFKPFGYQKLFLVKQRANVCSAKTEVVGEISQQKLISAVKEVIKEQSIFRYSYNKEKNCFQQYKYTDNWYVPYIDISNCENISEELVPFEAIFNLYPCFEDDRLLLKVVIIKISSDKHLIYFYIQHSIWDVVATEALGDSIKNKLLGIKENINENEYTEYTKTRRKNEKNLQEGAHKFLHEFDNQYKNYKELIKGQVSKCFINVSCNVEKNKLEYILKNPVEWIVRLFSMINIKELKGSEDKGFPVLQIQYGRKEKKNFKTAGLYLDLGVQMFNVESEKIISSPNSKYSFILIEPEFENTENVNDYFSIIPIVNFVKIVNPNYKTEKIDECKINMIKFPQQIPTKGYISITIINDTLHLMIPSFNENVEYISKVVKQYLK